MTLRICEVIRFYGFSHKEVMGLDYSEFLECFKAMKVLKARERLEKNSVADYSNLEFRKKQKLHSGLLKEAQIRSNKVISSASELKQILGSD